jgi:hypothetical protein
MHDEGERIRRRRLSNRFDADELDSWADLPSGTVARVEANLEAPPLALLAQLGLAEQPTEHELEQLRGPAPLVQDAVLILDEDHAWLRRSRDGTLTAPVYDFGDIDLLDLIRDDTGLRPRGCTSLPAARSTDGDATLFHFYVKAIAHPAEPRLGMERVALQPLEAGDAVLAVGDDEVISDRTTQGLLLRYWMPTRWS